MGAIEGETVSGGEASTADPASGREPAAASPVGKGASATAPARTGASKVSSLSGKLNMKDFMNIGIFTAVNMVIGIAVAVPLGMIPIGLMLLAAVGPIVSGIATMLFITKIKKPGMLFIMYLINGLMLLFTGMGPWALVIGCVTVTAAEAILRAGRYESAKLSVLAYGVSSISVVGNYVQWMVSGQDYVDSVAAGYGMEFAQTVAGYFTDPLVYVALAAVCFAAGLVGGVLGRAAFKKHFQRAGIV